MSTSTDTHASPAREYDLVREVGEDRVRHAPPAVQSEWLLTNGIGGYSSGTVSGELTRRYHGLLVAALAAPLGRVVMLTTLGERVRTPDGHVEWLTGADLAGHGDAHGAALTAFRLELGLPHWTFRLASGVLHKRFVMVYGQNSILLRYTYEGEGRIRLALRPFLAPRSHEQPISTDVAQPHETALHARGIELRFEAPLPCLQVRFNAPRAAFTAEQSHGPLVTYRTERDRGYAFEGGLWSPGYMRCDLSDGQSACLLASTEGWDIASALSPDDIEQAERDRRRQLLADASCPPCDSVEGELVLAADQFIVTPSWRTRDIARSRAGGVEPRSVVAGYHWFTDWGRDTMISLEGLTLATGRFPEARAILLSFAQHMKDGLIPNLFPEGDHSGLYHTADATLWMFHAVHRYTAATGDRTVVDRLLPQLQDSIERHLEGTRFNIRVDPADGLLSQGEPGYQLTWMDAKVDDWVVTPRRGKAVEINALWYNALRLTAEWTALQGDRAAAERLSAFADRAYESFNRRFWYAPGHHLFDVVDGERGDDPSLRPNQVFAISLEHPVLAPERWAPVMEVVRDRLLTPVGLRSLGPDEPDFKAQYYGDLRSRDAAYHQGTVWGWLIGPYVDAWLKLHPGATDEAARCLDGLAAHLGQAGLGTISEIFDAMPPFTPRGCIAQAWSVAEALRLWRALKHPPAGGKDQHP
jgi:predicted glycogen debranching enzyme